MLKKFLTSTFLIGALAVSSVSMASTAHAQDASANARYLAGEFERRHDANVELAADIARIAMVAEYPGIVVSEIMMSEQMTMEDREQFLDLVDPFFASAAAQATSELQAHVRRVGWDGIAEAGSVTMSIAFDIVATSRDLAFKRSTLSVFEPYAVNYDINSYSYALLHDDVMAASGEPQKYGTAGQCENGAWVPATMASTAQVDAAREEIGLGPMAELIEAESEYCSM